MKSLSLHLTCLLLLTLAPGCGTWVGNAVDHTGTGKGGDSNTPSMRVEISTQSSSPNGDLSAPHTGKDGTVAGSLQFSDIFLTVERVRFTKEGKEIAQSNWEGPRAIRLGALANELASDLSVAPDSFDEIHFETTNAPGAMAIKGSFVNGESTTPVDLTFTKRIEITVAVKAVEIRTEADKKSTVTVTLQLDHWFDFKGRNFDLRDLTAPITMSSRAELEDVLNSNVERSGEEAESSTKAPETSDDTPETVSPAEKDDDDD